MSTTTAADRPMSSAPIEVAAGGAQMAAPSPAVAALRGTTMSSTRPELARELPDRLRMRADRVHRWLRDARQRRDLQRTACLDDLLSQVHALERQAASVQAQALAAASEDDAARFERAVMRLTVHDESSAALLEQAQQCGRARRWLPPGSSVQQVRSTQPRLPPIGDDERRPVGGLRRAGAW